MLINCPECNKEISDRAVNCPNCGYPLNEIPAIKSNDNKLVYPDFPEDLSLGDSLVKLCSGFTIHDEIISNIPEFNNGRIRLDLYKNGIKASNNNISILIHKSQIICLSEEKRTEIAEKNKSVIGRAIVGGILTGGIGAVVGGVSGVGTKKEKVTKYYLTLKFWDINIREIKTITSIGLMTDEFFINRFNKEIMKK